MVNYSLKFTFTYHSIVNENLTEFCYCCTIILPNNRFEMMQMCNLTLTLRVVLGLRKPMVFVLYVYTQPIISLYYRAVFTKSLSQVLGLSFA